MDSLPAISLYTAQDFVDRFCCFSTEHWPSCTDRLDPGACSYSSFKHRCRGGVQCGAGVPANIRQVPQGSLSGDSCYGRATWWCGWTCRACPNTRLCHAWHSACTG